MRLTPCSSDLFFSKQDPQDPRLGERAVRSLPEELSRPAPVLWGAPDDEGIRLNGGRPGAAAAPQEIRRVLYKMTPPRGPFPEQIHDLGDLNLSGSLVDRHQRALGLATDLHRAGHFTLSLGGGHDYGFPDAAGFVEVFQGQNPLVLNFDAHLDVRPLDKGFHSGTPFRRLLEAFPKKFEFWELGLQPQCNSHFHAAWAETQGARLLFLDQLTARAPEQAGLPPQRSRPCFVSVDLDVFSSKEAPGCSQSWATGLTVENFLPWLQFLFASFDIRGLGFYEVSPPLDTDHRTSKLAALLIYHSLRLRAESTRP